MIMTACRKKLPRSCALKPTLPKLLPLEEYLQVKLSEQARTDVPESFNEIIELARMGSWDRICDDDILENKFRRRFVVKLVFNKLERLMLDEKTDVLEKLAQRFELLDGASLAYLVQCLRLTGSMETLAHMASDPFLRRNSAAEPLWENAARNGDVIDLPALGRILSDEIELAGGPKAFAGTAYHEYVLLFYATYHWDFRAQVRALEEYVRYYYEDHPPLKDVVLHATQPGIPEYLLRKMLTCGMISIGYSEYGDDDNSLMTWFLDSVIYRGTDDHVTRFLVSLFIENGVKGQVLEQLLEEHAGISGKIEASRISVKPIN